MVSNTLSASAQFHRCPSPGREGGNRHWPDPAHPSTHGDQSYRSLADAGFRAHCDRSQGGAPDKVALSRQAGFILSRRFFVQPQPQLDLHQLREVKLTETHGAIRGDIFKLRQAAYATSVIEQATETETPLLAVYGLMRGFLHQLCLQKTAPQLIFALELKLLLDLGLSPNLAESNLAAGTKKIASILAQQDWAAGLRLKLTGAQEAELRSFLHDFLIFHLGRLPRVTRCGTGGCGLDFATGCRFTRIGGIICRRRH